MACFIAPATAATIVTSVRKKIPAKYHLDWLIFMLWGGVAMFFVEHIIKGEIVLYPPFLTAMKNPADTLAMCHEIVTIGVPMTITVFAIWIIMVLFSLKITKLKNQKKLTIN